MRLPARGPVAMRPETDALFSKQRLVMLQGVGLLRIGLRSQASTLHSQVGASVSKVAWPVAMPSR